MANPASPSPRQHDARRHGKRRGKDVEPKYIENPVKEEYIQGQHADISKIQEVLGYDPQVELEDGIRHQVENLRMDRIRETSSDSFR